uniref:EF-hand domain-containing protein n=1 Tax=Heterorhabditis bacteriophora TaxID=37862 RepID=A0A1I7X0Z9_HETBA
MTSSDHTLDDDNTHVQELKRCGIFNTLFFIKLGVVYNSYLNRLTRYEARLLCENTPDLDQLSVIDINGLFERADADRTGRISVQQFLAQYRLQKRLSAEVHFIADSYVSSLNLFEALDPTNSGTIDCQDLMEYWSKAGLRIDEGLAVLMAPVAVKWILMCTIREVESRAEHLHKQLQIANQRRTLLIEELEHNQLSIEQGYEKRLRLVFHALLRLYIFN